jgi:hypothetical protein
MSMNVGTYSTQFDHGRGISVEGLRFAVFSTRNLVFYISILAMNYTLMRPSPVDLLYMLAFILTLVLLSMTVKPSVTARFLVISILALSWLGASALATLPHMGEEGVVFELISKTFAISIGITAAFVGMSWTKRHFEFFMMVYIVSTVVGGLLGTAGFVLQHELLTWDGRAKGLIDDPNMYGTFLLPGAMFCAYFYCHGKHRLLMLGALAVIMLGILLCFSRIAVVAAILCLLAYFIVHYRNQPRRIFMLLGILVVAGAIVFGIASAVSGEFMAKLLDRLTFAKSYDLGEQGRYARYFLVIPMSLENPLGLGLMQLEKIFPEPIHNIWLSSFVNYGWIGGFSWIALAAGTLIISIWNFRQFKCEISVVLLISFIGVVLGATLHEGEHWRQMWLTMGLVWGLNHSQFAAQKRREMQMRCQQQKTA